MLHLEQLSVNIHGNGWCGPEGLLHRLRQRRRPAAEDAHAAYEVKGPVVVRLQVHVREPRVALVRSARATPDHTPEHAEEIGPRVLHVRPDVAELLLLLPGVVHHEVDVQCVDQGMHLVAQQLQQLLVAQHPHDVHAAPPRRLAALLGRHRQHLKGTVAAALPLPALQLALQVVQRAQDRRDADAAAHKHNLVVQRKLDGAPAVRLAHADDLVLLLLRDELVRRRAGAHVLHHDHNAVPAVRLDHAEGVRLEEVAVPTQAHDGARLGDSEHGDGRRAGLEGKLRVRLRRRVHLALQRVVRALLAEEGSDNQRHQPRGEEQQVGDRVHAREEDDEWDEHPVAHHEDVVHLPAHDGQRCERDAACRDQHEEAGQWVHVACLLELRQLHVVAVHQVRHAVQPDAQREQLPEQRVVADDPLVRDPEHPAEDRALAAHEQQKNRQQHLSRVAEVQVPRRILLVVRQRPPRDHGRSDQPACRQHAVAQGHERPSHLAVGRKELRGAAQHVAAGQQDGEEEEADDEHHQRRQRALLFVQLGCSCVEVDRRLAVLPGTVLAHRGAAVGPGGPDDFHHTLHHRHVGRVLCVEQAGKGPPAGTALRLDAGLQDVVLRVWRRRSVRCHLPVVAGDGGAPPRVRVRHLRSEPDGAPRTFLARVRQRKLRVLARPRQLEVAVEHDGRVGRVGRRVSAQVDAFDAGRECRHVGQQGAEIVLLSGRPGHLCLHCRVQHDVLGVAGVQPPGDSGTEVVRRVAERVGEVEPDVLHAVADGRCPLRVALLRVPTGQVRADDDVGTQHAVVLSAEADCAPPALPALDREGQLVPRRRPVHPGHARRVRELQHTLLSGCDGLRRLRRRRQRCRHRSGRVGNRRGRQRGCEGRRRRGSRRQCVRHRRGSDRCSGHRCIGDGRVGGRCVRDRRRGGQSDGACSSA
eukprot:Rhum_TRINITY_DN15592_c0_g1::Rhum_TRINITY_DN15592_c0_g1_i1::g.161396::m.161396